MKQWNSLGKLSLWDSNQQPADPDDDEPPPPLDPAFCGFCDVPSDELCGQEFFFVAFPTKKALLNNQGVIKRQKALLNKKQSNLQMVK